MITHPLLPDITQKTDEELMEIINTLGNKLSYMYKFNKPDMVRQISMVLNAYRQEFSKRQEEKYSKTIGNTDKININ